MKKSFTIASTILGLALLGLFVSSCTNTGGGTHRMGTGKAHQTGMPDAHMPGR